MTTRKTNPLLYFIVGLFSVPLLYQIQRSRVSFGSPGRAMDNFRKLLFINSNSTPKDCDNTRFPRLCDADDVNGFDFKKAQQEDPRLIDYIRRELLDPPSTGEYRLARPKTVHFSQFHQSVFANRYFLRDMKGGFFVEVGAYDGEKLSNTLFFERELRWKGLLIEVNPDSYQQLLKRHRKAYSVNVALSPTKQTEVINFQMNGLGGKITDEGGVPVQAIPLYSLLKALNVTVVDFLSLDIEGLEVKILKTIPWDKVKFRLMCIEVNHIPEGPDFLKEYLTGKGYRFLKEFGIDMWFGWPELLDKTIGLSGYS